MTRLNCIPRWIAVARRATNERQRRCLALWISLALLTGGLFAVTATAAQPQPEVALELLEQQAFQSAVQRATDAVVQIRTVGGLDRLDGQSLTAGPATGVVLTSDGYIVSSAFHFASRPTSILVQLPGGDQRPAELIGNDESRMLTLLKVDVDGPLPTAVPAPIDDIQVGQWAIAVGRTFRAEQVNVSIGIVSALGRKNGRVIQTDASVSAANYGGPLLDIEGRTLGVLVPMSPQPTGLQGESAVAGAEFYDSGIGFAAPLQHVLDVLPRWIERGELHPGVLGIGLKKGSQYASQPLVQSVWPGSPAAVAGWQANDLIVAVDGVPIATQSQLRRHIAPRYAGDVVSVRLRRSTGKEPDQIETEEFEPDEIETEEIETEEIETEEIETEVTLAAELPAYRHAFLGVLPMRTAPAGDESEPSGAGVAIRAVWPDSPADQIGLQAKDRILQLGNEQVGSIEDAWDQLQSLNVGDPITIEIDREGETLELSTQVGQLPSQLFPDSDLRSAYDGLQDDDSAADLNAVDVRFPEFPQDAWIFSLGSQRPRGLVLWLGAKSRSDAVSLAARWAELGRRGRFALVVAAPASDGGWSAEDLPFAERLLQHAAKRLGADPRRSVVAGAGKAGQLAYALALGTDAAAGVASIDGPLPRSLTIPKNRPGRRISILAIESTDSPFSVLMRQDAAKLAAQGYPVALESRPGQASPSGEPDADDYRIIARWIDGLDRF